jgi:anti-sigma regulatory factor (Ser/Thr protein kinase)
MASPTDTTASLFRHEAFLYESDEQYAEVGAEFLRQGLDNDEAMLVVVGPEKIELLRAALGPDAGRVEFADMRDVGRNPARIIPVWGDFVGRQISGRKLRGIGEPVWAGRSEAELAECYLHESLLNHAFAGQSFTLLCPYDARALGPAVLDHSHFTHPLIRNGSAPVPSAAYHGFEGAGQMFAATLPEPSRRPGEFHVEHGRLPELRSLVYRRARAAGLEPYRTRDLVLAVNELATNSLLHGRGRGVLRWWRDPDSLVFEVRDAGFIEDPLVGRIRPGPDQTGGRGLWVVNQLCDLVQIRTSPTGTVVRVLMTRT